MHLCYYCEKPVSKPWEFQRDHFPVPRRAGGKETVIACAECHHKKDRTRHVVSQEQIDKALSNDHVLFLQGNFISKIEDKDVESAIELLKFAWDGLPVELRLCNAAIISRMF